MRLLSFQILNCFGFKDSGEINLDDSNNIIYLLGRNSSGKTSVLNALNCLNAGIPPKEAPRFRNFDSKTQGKLIAVYSVERGELTCDQLLKDVKAVLNKTNINNSVIQKYEPIAEFFKTITTIYQKLIEAIERAGRVRVEKSAEGNYLIILDNPNSPQERIREVSNSFRKAFPDSKIKVEKQNYDVRLNARDMENLLFNQFPLAMMFSDQYSLGDDLPDRIPPQNMNDPASPLTRAFIDYLDRGLVKRFLESEDPDDRGRYLEEMQAKAERLKRDINKEELPVGFDPLLSISLSMKDGIQITLRTDEKKSYYRQLSDNTKFLFAYHLYSAQREDQPSILLFDEPNKGFHATAEVMLLEFLKSLAKKGEQVIVATHSEHMIDPDFLTGTRLTVTEDGDMKVLNCFTGGKRRDGEQLALQPLFNAIGLRYFSGLTAKEEVILVEGITDMLYLKGFSRLLQFEETPAFAPARGVGTILNLIPLFISQNIRMKFLIDTCSEKETIQKKYEVPDNCIYEVPIPDGYAEGVKGSGIEDLFDKKDFRKILNAVDYEIEEDSFSKTPNSQYAKRLNNEKRIIAWRFHEFVVAGRNWDFSEQTFENFRAALEFCHNENWFSI